jgi:hypothetical protein
MSSMTAPGRSSSQLFCFATPVETYPYPYVVQDDFLPPTLYKELKRTFPSVENFGKPFRMHGDLTWGDEVYMSLLNSAAWRSLHEYVHSEDHVRQMCSVFAESLAQHVEKGELLFEPDRLTFDEHVEGRAIRKDVLDESSGPARLFTRLDLGYGIEDYGRRAGGGGVHIDNASRLFSTLIYFSDARDFEGGEFEIYECRHGLPRLYKRIATAENRAIVSLQSNVAYHAVNPVAKCVAPRYALYIAIASRRRLWKRISNPLLAMLSQNRFETGSRRARRVANWVRPRVTPFLRAGARNRD